MKGKFKWWNRFKGYGFIKGDDGIDRFVHFTGVEIDRAVRDNIKGGESVTFEERIDDKGRSAVKVRLIIQSTTEVII